MEILQFLLAPLVASLILAGMHAYLGVHVVERGVIFVDLALAQIAALGTTIGFLLGLPLHGTGTYWFSLGFTFCGAGLFALTRMHQGKIPQEAFIGITYAVSAAAAILVMSKAPEGAEHIKDMLVGNILVVSWADVWKTGALYGVISVFHWIFRRKFLAISLDADAVERQGVAVRFWDFLFYVLFGFVVTVSVSIAGVLLVFSYLIVPSVTAMLFAERIGPRLAIGWTMGTAVSAIGVTLSFLMDLPTAATIVVTFGATLVLAALVRVLLPRRESVMGAPARAGGVQA